MTDKKLQTEPKTSKVDFFIHAVLPNGENNDSRIGQSIGCGFLHKNGENFTLLLDATPHPNPITGQIKLVGFKPK